MLLLSHHFCFSNFTPNNAHLKNHFFLSFLTTICTSSIDISLREELISLCTMQLFFLFDFTNDFNSKSASIMDQNRSISH